MQKANSARSPPGTTQEPARGPDGGVMEDPNGYLPPLESDDTRMRALSCSPTTRRHPSGVPAAPTSQPAGQMGTQTFAPMRLGGARWAGPSYNRKPQHRSASPPSLRNQYSAGPQPEPQMTPEPQPPHVRQSPAAEERARASARSGSVDRADSSDSLPAGVSAAKHARMRRRASDSPATPTDSPSEQQAVTRAPARLDIPFHFPGAEASDAPTPNLMPRDRQVTFRSGSPSELNTLHKERNNLVGVPSSAGSESVTGRRSGSRKTLSDALSHRPLFQSGGVHTESSHGSVLPPHAPVQPVVFATPDEFYAKDTSQLDLGAECSVRESPYFAMDTHALDSAASSASYITNGASLPNRHSAAGGEITLRMGSSMAKRVGSGADARGAPDGTQPSRNPVATEDNVDLQATVSDNQGGVGWSGYQPPSPPRFPGGLGKSPYSAGSRPPSEIRSAQEVRYTQDGKPISLAGFVAPSSTLTQSTDMQLHRQISGMAKAGQPLKTKGSGPLRSLSLYAHTPVVQEDVALIMELQCAPCTSERIHGQRQWSACRECALNSAPLDIFIFD
jgi:hypothetical protein